MKIRPSNLRMLWLLRRIERQSGSCVAWDEELVDAFCDTFPEAKITLRLYLIGANSSPMLNLAANRAKKLGFLRPSSVGTTDARSFNQRTWARVWYLTDAGKDYIRFVEKFGGTDAEK